METAPIPALRLLALLNLGAAYAKSYQLAATEEHWAQAQQIGQQAQLREWNAELHRYLALAHLARLELPRALVSAQTAITYAQAAHALSEQGAALRVLVT